MQTTQGMNCSSLYNKKKLKNTIVYENKDNIFKKLLCHRPRAKECLVISYISHYKDSAIHEYRQKVSTFL